MPIRLLRTLVFIAAVPLALPCIAAEDAKPRVKVTKKAAPAASAASAAASGPKQPPPGGTGIQPKKPS